MTLNKIPLAIGFDPATGNASGLSEFTLNLSDVGNVCDAVPSNNQVLAYSATTGKWCASTITFPAGGGGSTQNLGYIASAAKGTVTITGGTDATLPVVTTTAGGNTAGLMIPGDKTKLDGIETNATADQTASDIKTLLQSDKLTASEIANDAIGTNQIDDDAVTFAKVQHIATDTILGRDSASDGIVEVLSPATVRTLLNVENGADVTDTTNVAAAGAIMTSATTADSRTFLTTTAKANDLTNVNFNDSVAKTELLLRNSDTIFASALNEGAVTLLFGSDGTGDGEIDFTPSSSAGGSTLISENISGTNVSADSLTVANDITVAGNLFLSGNLNATYTSLANAGITTTLHREVGAPVASSNSTSLAELVSYTLPANVLTLGDIDITVRGRQLAQGSNLRWNFKIGGTNILNSSISQGTYSDMTAYSMDIQISKTATDKQLVTASFRQSTGSSSAAGRGSWAGIHRDGIIVNYDAAGDESTALALSLEAQQSDAAQTVTVDHFIVKLIPNPFA